MLFYPDYDPHEWPVLRYLNSYYRCKEEEEQSCVIVIGINSVNVISSKKTVILDFKKGGEKLDWIRHNDYTKEMNLLDDFNIDFLRELKGKFISDAYKTYDLQSFIRGYFDSLVAWGSSPSVYDHPLQTVFEHFKNVTIKRDNFDGAISFQTPTAMSLFGIIRDKYFQDRINEYGLLQGDDLSIVDSPDYPLKDHLSTKFIYELMKI